MESHLKLIEKVWIFSLGLMLGFFGCIGLISVLVAFALWDKK